jgi:hypothetical protein
MADGSNTSRVADPVAFVAQQLEAKGCAPVKSPNGHEARCPAHEDRNRSLSVGKGASGQALLHCQAGCEIEQVCAALDMTMSQLYPAESAPPRSGKLGQMVATYDYVNEQGERLFQVCRFEPKNFRQRRPDPGSKDGWSWSIKGVRQVAYRLPKVLASVMAGAAIFVVEGEKDVAALEELGVTATCNAGGATKWKSDHAKSLHGAKLVVAIADKDAPGRAHAATVARSLQGHVGAVRVLELPGDAVKDAADWVKAGGTREQLDALVSASADVPADTQTKREHFDAEREVRVVAKAVTLERNAPLSRSFGSLCDIFEIPDLAKPVLAGALEYNEMSGQIAIGRQVVDDNSVNAVRRLIELTHCDKNGAGLTFTDTEVWKALALIASKHPFHPVREYLDGLKWDGVERIASIPEDILGTEGTPIQAALMRRFLISAVARVQKPGIKADCMLVLQGAQGAKKSSFLKMLAGEEWFADTPMDIHNKDSYLQLRGVWIYEWGELESMARARDINVVKGFLSSPSDSYRAPYGKGVVRVPRSGVVAGSTNEPQFLVDVTGNRRFWPIVTGEDINLEMLAQQRDQIWAEAQALYVRGEQHYLTPEEATALGLTNEEHLHHDAWETLVDEYLRQHLDVLEITTASLLENVIRKPAGQWGRADEMRVAKVMRALGYGNARKGDRTDRRRIWTKN